MTYTKTRSADSQEFIVVDIHTGQAVSRPTTAKRARAIKDRKDAQYGACRYVIQVKQAAAAL